VREKIERLEHHPDIAAQAVHVDVLLVDAQAVNNERAAVDRFEPIDRADHRALAGSRRADDDDDLAFAQ